MEKNKPKVLILYEYFYPGYKAGGPIQSLVNMISLLSSQNDFLVSTTAFDLNEKEAYKTVKINAWNNTIINKQQQIVNVFYAGKKKVSFFQLLNNIKQSHCDIVYINGFYTRHFLFPLIYKKLNLLSNKKIIVSPRGMLQSGALQSKSYKKNAFIFCLKILGLLSNIIYHATSKDEEEDIKKIFGNKSKTIVAGNIPKKPKETEQKNEKVKGHLRLIYLSLITEKKNLDLLLKVISNSKKSISLDIFGPIKDEIYWQKCLQLIKNIPTNISIVYKGDIDPMLVQETLAQYNALIILTKGENFGHALYESLSVATPIITSKFTPWQNLQENFAGWVVDIDDEQSIIKQLDDLVEYDNIQWKDYNVGALNLAKQYFVKNNFEKDYSLLFNTNEN